MTAQAPEFPENVLAECDKNVGPMVATPNLEDLP